jgi:serine/threonine protein kinase
MDEHRFYYVTPYHEGDHLGIVTRQLHGESEGQGLGARELATGLGYVADLLDTLSRYHGGGLWHKDVKPENVIVHDGRAHLVDLGLVTPLRSAMTLTTHGTEYFRDPEMVRMALRGVKVHQVDGAKFDIYAVGAVLYFLLENTFPAHGALSAFSRRSPEALRWIVRRAMADYSKRYETAAAVLADLGAVRAAADPYAVRPADLPSMGGSTPEAPHAAADGAPQRPREAAVASSAGSPRPPAAATAGFGHPGAGTGTRSWSEPTRPAVRVTNWWTGAYQAVEPGGAGALPAMSSQEARIYREEAAAFREHSEALREQVRRRTVSARRAAREQLRAARQRAEEVRRRARANRRRLVPEPQRVQPGVVMAFLTLLVAGAIALAAISRNAPRSPGAAVQEALGSAYAFRFSPDLALPDGRGTPLLLLNDHPAWTSPLVRSEVDRALEVLRLRGYHIVSGDKDAEARVRATGTIQAHEPIPAPLRAVLRQRKLGGVIRIYAAPGEGDVSERVEIVYTLPE